MIEHGSRGIVVVDHYFREGFDLSTVHVRSGKADIPKSLCFLGTN